MLFEKFVREYGIDRFVADGADAVLLVVDDEARVNRSEFGIQAAEKDSFVWNRPRK